MVLNDAVTGAALVVFAVAEITYARTFPSLHGQSYGPDLFPTLIGAGLIVCGLILIGRGLGSRKLSAQQTPVTGDGSEQQNNISIGSDNRLNVMLVLLALLFYIFLSSSIGFIPTSILIMTTLLYRLGSSLFVSLTVATVSTLIIQLLFAKVLLVPLPPGLLQGLVW